MQENNRQIESRQTFQAGALLVVLGLLLNEWVFAALFSPDGALDTTARLGVWGFDMLLVTLGLVLIFMRARISVFRPLAGLFAADGRSLEILLWGGLALRILVFFFLEPGNNDPHLEVVEYIAANRSLPNSAELLMAFHPPLYYVLAAPWALLGSPKVVQVFSLLLSLANFYLLYRLIKSTVLLQDPQARGFALLFTAVLPQFVIFGNFVSNDALVFPLGTLAVLLAFRYIEEPTRKNLLGLGILTGIGILTKGTFLAFLAVLGLVVLLKGLGEREPLSRQVTALAIFSAAAVGLGSYKFIENLVNFGTFFPDGIEVLGHTYILRQRPTVLGLSSFIDINVFKLTLYPFVSVLTLHSLPLLFYATFWYGYIPESNFDLTRTFPFHFLPRFIVLAALLPTALMLLGAARYFWRIRNPLALIRQAGETLNLRLKETVVTLFLLLNFGIVLFWGVQHDAWSFFQGRLMFPSFFSLAILLGWGYESLGARRPAWRPFLNVGLLLVHAILLAYLLLEVSGQIL